MLDWPGAPPRSYEFLWGLSLCLGRAELRQRFAWADALMVGLKGEFPAEYFGAMFDDPTEAAAMWNIYQNRLESARRHGGGG